MSLVKSISEIKPIEEKEQIRKMIVDLYDALSAKDVRKMMAYYADDVVVYDVKPPFQTKGAVIWRHTWEACMPYFPDQFSVAIKDLYIHVSSDIAIAHWMFRLVGPEKEHDAMQTWMRATTGYKKIKGKWKIVHEHGSLPFDPHTTKAIFSLNV
ncbi:MAG: nuclear transport factor 2 family protein [Saprospiraceae bacterium]